MPGRHPFRQIQHAKSHISLRPCLHALVLSTSNILERPLKMPLRIVETRHIFGGIEIRVDQLDEPVEVLGRDRVVLLVEVVDVAIQDLYEELD